MPGAKLATATVAVLGGGIIGAAIARELTCVGVDVVVLDAAAAGTGTSGRGDGNVLLQTKHESLGVRMTQYGIARYARWAEELDDEIHFERRGSTVFFTDDAEADAAQKRVGWLLEHGVAARYVGFAELHEIEPGLSDRARGGIDCLDDSTVYPPAVVTALLRDACRRGARVMPYTAARRLLTDKHGAVRGVATDQGEVAAAAVVNALGPWAAELDGDPGITIPVQPRQGILAVIDEGPYLVNRAVTEATYMTNRVGAGTGTKASVAFVAEPTAFGNVLIGSTRRFCGFDTSVDLGLLAEVIRRAVSFLPTLANCSIIRTFAGLRPWTPDNRPMIGASHTVPGYYLAIGHEGEGIGLAPITADVITALITEASIDALFAEVLAAADPHRFAQTVKKDAP